jgi:acetyl esterase/lipase
MRRLLLPALLLPLFLRAADPARVERPLWETAMPFPQTAEQAPAVDGKGRPKPAGIPTLTVYPAPATNNTGIAVVICPGGGYGGHAIQHEGHQVGAFLQANGITGIVLPYRLPRPDLPQGHLTSLADAQESIRWTRRHAAEFGVQTNRVGILGFSAGGHLCASACTLFDEAVPGVDARGVSARPDFGAPIYPVISSDPAIRHGGSFQNLLGRDAPAEMLEKFSIEKRVTSRNPPTFTAHSEDDPVKVGNSRVYADALRKAGVPVTQIEFKTGGHGYGMGKPGSEPAVWPARFVAFARETCGVK